jgi:chemosensory pili system protein ChpA (sensor histidine kinase/response regulator)
LPDDSVKIIGSLRIGIPLYNVFLNEADEWSRRLQIELGEWALEWHRPLPESPIALAHSLAGSSATVGFVALSEVARSLESCMQHVQLHHAGNDKHAQVFAAAAEDIRHLLHQFAAGFLKEPDSQVLSALKAVAKADFEAQVSRSDRLDTAHTTTPHSDPVALPAAKLTLAPAAALAAVPEDDIDCEDALDADLFPIFDEEAQELLPQLVEPCGNGLPGQRTWKHAAKHFGFCTHSKAAHAWRALCGWAR